MPDELLISADGPVRVVTLKKGRTVAFEALPLPSTVSHCLVNAGGVRAEWVEATTAHRGQPTFVYLSWAAANGDGLEAARPTAARLACTTGGRVFSVECATVEDGIIAYAWLCGEGLELDATVFVASRPTAGLNDAVLRLARERHLPVPGRELLSHPATEVDAIVLEP